MFAVSFVLLWQFFNPHNVKRINMRLRFRGFINNNYRSWRDCRKIRIRYPDGRAVGQAKHKRFRIPIEPFTD